MNFLEAILNVSLLLLTFITLFIMGYIIGYEKMESKVYKDEEPKSKVHFIDL